MTSGSPVVLITGASSGLGAAIASALVREGWDVWAGSRRGKTDSERAKALTLDVTDPTSVQSAISEIVNQRGRLDAIICNAGINVSAPAEELPDTLARRIVDTNLWGVIHTVKAALPHLRASQGRIIATGSLAGIVAPPGEAYYAASKHGLRGFLESLQYETHEHGIRVSLVEPGYIRTGLAESAVTDWPRIAVYDGLREALSNHWAQAISKGMEPSEVAETVAALVADDTPPFRVRVGDDAKWIPRIKALVPVETFFRVTAKKFGIGRKRP